MDDLLEYIDWSGICGDHDLKTGDITPYQQRVLNIILTKFIKQNK